MSPKLCTKINAKVLETSPKRENYLLILSPHNFVNNISPSNLTLFNVHFTTPSRLKDHLDR